MSDSANKKSRVRIAGYILLMGLFGGLGPIVRAIGFPTILTTCLRAWIAALALILFMVVSRHKVSGAELKKQLVPMIFSGIFLFGDWFGLFMSYNYTTIATATVCYYIVPILVLLASPIVLKEKYTMRHLVCAIVAFGGMIFISGVAENGFAATDIRGPLYALLGAVSYMAVVLINKKYPEGDPVLRSTIQLLVAGIFTTPVVCFAVSPSEVTVTAKSIILLIVLGVCMTAATYIGYFSLIVKIPARTVAIFSYADPVVAVLLSVFVLSEPMGWTGVVGTVLIIGSAVFSELRG